MNILVADRRGSPIDGDACVQGDGRFPSISPDIRADKFSRKSLNCIIKETIHWSTGNI